MLWQLNVSHCIHQEMQKQEKETMWLPWHFITQVPKHSLSRCTLQDMLEMEKNIHMYWPLKQSCHQGTQTSLFLLDLMKLIDSIIKDVQERKRSYLSQHSKSSKNLKPSCRCRLFKSFWDSILSDITSKNDNNSTSLENEPLNVPGNTKHCVTRNKKSTQAGNYQFGKSDRVLRSRDKL